MLDSPPTPASTLYRARSIALHNGIRYAYVGNVFAPGEGSTYCHQCGATLIGREWFDVTTWNLTADGHCQTCGAQCSGVFEGPPPATNGRLMPVRIEAFASES
jgi:pyruvate formate lyase activating enzyme